MNAGAVVVGHPVDVATGTVTLTREDIWITGVLPLVWQRHYSTALLAATPDALGPGWTSPFFASLARHGTDIIFRMPEGGVHVFAGAAEALMRGQIVRDLASFQELAAVGDRFLITRWDVVTGRVHRLGFRMAGDICPLTSIEDLGGRAIDLLRDGTGRLQEIRQRLEQRALLLDYDGAGQILSVSMRAPGHIPELLASYEYDSGGMLYAASDALGQRDYYEYTAHGMLSRERLKDGGVFYFQYDEKGRCTKTAGLDRYDEKTLTYHDAIRWTEVTDSLGNVSRYNWLPTGQILRVVSPTGAMQDTQYDEFLRITAKIDANGVVTSYEYDEYGNRARITRALGHETVLVFNEHHQYVKLIDPDGHVWKREFDAFHRVIGSENPLGGRWTYRRDANGQVVHVTNPNGATRALFYSDTGTLIAETDWEGNVSRYVTDHFGRFVERHDPRGGVTGLTFDAVGHPMTTIYPDGSTATNEYDVAGNIIRTIDAKGNVSVFHYGSCRRLVQRIDPVGRKVTYRWSTEPRRLNSITNEKGEVHEFVRDAVGRVVCERGFDGRELRFEYDLAGNCVATINGAGERNAFTFDDLGRLSSKLLADGTLEEWTYDLRGNPLTAVNACTRIAFERDALGRVIREQQDGYTIERAWDGMSEEKLLRTSCGLQADYTRDGNGALTGIEVDGRKLLFERDALGLETDRHLPGNVHLRQTHDVMAQLKEQRVTIETQRGAGSQHPSPSSYPGRGVIRRAYEHDPAGSVTAISDERWGLTQYRYDPTHRLVQVFRDPGTNEEFAYDETGNITLMHADETPQTLTYGGGNRLLRQDNVTFAYDENGRRTHKVEHAGEPLQQEWHYGWDPQDQLTAVTLPDGSVWTYTYDAFGRRVRKEGPNASIRYVWDEDVVVHEIHGSTLKTSWIYDKDSMVPLYTLQAGDGFAVIGNHLGAPKELLDARGRVVWGIDHSAWGSAVRVTSNAVTCPLRNKGQWADPESGLYYNRFRYYDPSTGNFISQDPIGIRGALNFYRYVKNPINWVDPFGLADAPPCGDADDDPAMAEQARRDAERDMREADRGLDAHDKEFYGGDGTIYLVPGEGTPSGRPYVGSADDLDQRAATATDGRDRSKAVPIGSYPIGDRDARRLAEQQAIDDYGGLANLDNRRNEIRKK